MSHSLFSLPVIALLFTLTCCSQPADYLTTEGQTHTYYRVKYQHKESLDEEIRSTFRAYYHAINPFDSTSVISSINQNKDMTADPLFIRAFNKSMELSVETDGMFDVTCAPMLNYWGFGFKQMEHVKAEDLDSLKQFVGYQKIRLNGNKIVKDDPRIQLNFSAIGDGYICDLIAELLDKKGIENYMIDIGGEMLVKGINPKGDAWNIGINKPVDDSTQMNNELQQILYINDRMGIATSGDYRNFYLKDGKKYAHTLNPKTGYPAGQDILSATIITKDCTTADGMATACMSLGREKAKALMEKHPELEYFFIYADEAGNYQTEYSPGMNKYLRK